jgi:hypothetical protein
MGNSDSAGTSGPNIIFAANRNLSFGVGTSFTAADGGTFTEYVRIDSSGNVGIGTSSPAFKLDVPATVQFQGITIGANGTDIKSTTYGPITLQAQASGAGTNSYAAIYTSGSERMRIDSSGNVGIGTTSPGSPLDVNGTITARCPPSGTGLLMRGRSADNVSQILGYDFGVTTLYGQVQFVSTGGGSTTLISNGATGYTNFYTNGSERMRLDNAGNVGIGTNSPTSFGGTNLNIKAPSSSAYGSILVESGTYVWEVLVNQNSGTMAMGSRSNHSVTICTNDTTRVTIDTSGNLTATGNITAYSDARLKTNVSTIDNALALVEKMRGVRYDRIDSGKAGVGVIAQEMQEVVPEVVHEGENLSVAYGNLVGVLIEAVKELSARVKELEAK